MTIDVPGLVHAAGGKIVGKVRLQKLVYLLDQLGLESGFSYEYRHYGPYSADLAEQVLDDVIFARLVEKEERRLSDGVPYAMYTAGLDVDVTAHGPLASARIRSALAALQQRSATVLELAATMHWLAVFERRQDWRKDLCIRKGVKADNGRDQQAFDLLHALALPPAVNAATAR